jgi:uncharacterized protein (DUF885 family)
MITRFLACAAATWLAAGVLAAQPRTIDDFFASFTADWVRGNPNQATSTRYFSGDEQQRLDRELTSVSLAWQRERIALARKGQAELAAFNRSGLTEVQRVSADVLQWQLESIVEGEKYLDYFFPFEQFNGINVGLVSTLTIGHPIASESDALNYLAKLEQVDTRMDEGLVDARQLAGVRMAPPRFILRTTLNQMRQFTDGPAAANPLVSTLAERLSSVQAVSASRRAELVQRAEGIVAGEVYPAWRRVIAFLETLEARAGDDAGLWRLDGGAEAYAYNLRRYTTTTLSADDIHQIGLRMVDEIQKEMDAIFRKLGRTEGSVRDRVRQLERDLAYPLTDEGRTRIMADIEGMMRDAEKRAAADFERQPKASVVAMPYPRFREASAAAGYNSPAPDGSRPGIFQIPLRPDYMTKFGLRTLVYHETVPGHHFQIALEMENTASPRFRRLRAFGGIPALSEGWGLYAERFAAESGWYENDLEGRLGQLDAALFRARRLVVDTGLHAKRWTRQQAIDYGIEASEVERYVVYPGQACAYMLGQLKIVELREKARKAMGDRFSLRAYHTAVLNTGSVPLPVLERQIDAFIKGS